MIVSAHQPHFLPWTGYVNRIYLSDVFVIMDNMEYTRNNFVSRNRIITRNGISYLTIPVEYKGKSHSLISDIKVNEIRYEHYVSKHLETIRHSYSKRPGFNSFYPILRSALNERSSNLLSLNIKMLSIILDYLNIKTNILLGSSLNIAGNKSDGLFSDLCIKTGCVSLLLGLGASTKYIDKESVSSQGVEVCYQKFSHPVYPQRTRTFVSGISIIDLIFNVEKSEAELLVKKSGSIEKKI